MKLKIETNDGTVNLEGDNLSFTYSTSNNLEIYETITNKRVAY